MASINVQKKEIRMVSTNTNRNYGLDALRIISMLMVVALHVLGTGGFEKSDIVSVSVFSFVIRSFARVAVNCYILISGFFLCQKSFKLSRVTSTYVQTWFYSVFTFLFLVLINGIAFSKGMFVKSLLPFTFKNYWFVTYYILMLFIAPLLNSAFINMSKNKFRLVLLVLVGIFIVWNNVVAAISPISDLDGFSISLFLILYCVSGYIRKFYTPSGKWYKYLFCYLGLTILSIALHYVLLPLGDFYSGFLLLSYKGVFCVAASVCLFLTFLNLSIKSKVVQKTILFFAPLTFAVYLIHESLGFKVYLWEIINPNTITVTGPLFAAVAILIILAIFIVCALIEYLRQLVFRVLRVDYFVKFVSDKVEIIIRKMVNR